MALQIFINRFIDGDKEQIKFCEPDYLPTIPDWEALHKTIKKSGVPYDTGKRVIHADNYGMAWPTYLDYTLKESDGEVQLTKEEGMAHLGTKAALFPEIGDLKRELIEMAQRDRILYNLLGYPIQLTQPWNNAMERKALACIPQSTVGCITHLAVCRMYENDIIKDRRDWTIINNKHDSFAVFHKPEDREEVQHKMVKYLCVELRWKDTVFEMKAEASTGLNFGKWSEDNPNGLKEAA